MAQTYTSNVLCYLKDNEKENYMTISMLGIHLINTYRTKYEISPLTIALSNPPLLCNKNNKHKHNRTAQMLFNAICLIAKKTQENDKKTQIFKSNRII